MVSTYSHSEVEYALVTPYALPIMAEARYSPVGDRLCVSVSMACPEVPAVISPTSQSHHPCQSARLRAAAVSSSAPSSRVSFFLSSELSGVASIVQSATTACRSARRHLISSNVISRPASPRGHR